MNESDYYVPVPESTNAATEAVVAARTDALLRPDNSRMNEDPSTPKCTQVLADINACQGDLAAAARRLKGGGPENALPELP